MWPHFIFGSGSTTCVAIRCLHKTQSLQLSEAVLVSNRTNDMNPSSDFSKHVNQSQSITNSAFRFLVKYSHIGSNTHSNRLLVSLCFIIFYKYRTPSSYLVVIATRGLVLSWCEMPTQNWLYERRRQMLVQNARTVEQGNSCWSNIYLTLSLFIRRPGLKCDQHNRVYIVIYMVRVSGFTQQRTNKYWLRELSIDMKQALEWGKHLKGTDTFKAQNN